MKIRKKSQRKRYAAIIIGGVIIAGSTYPLIQTAYALPMPDETTDPSSIVGEATQPATTDDQTQTNQTDTPPATPSGESSPQAQSSSDTTSAPVLQRGKSPTKTRQMTDSKTTATPPKKPSSSTNNQKQTVPSSPVAPIEEPSDPLAATKSDPVTSKQPAIVAVESLPGADTSSEAAATAASQASQAGAAFTYLSNKIDDKTAKSMYVDATIIGLVGVVLYGITHTGLVSPAFYRRLVSLVN